MTIGDMNPRRVQLSRRKGWRMPPNTIKVDRTTKFGNPFLTTKDRSAAEAVNAFRYWFTIEGCDAGIPDEKAALLAALPSIRGKNIACWCPEGPCHADVLLAVANEVLAA